MTVHSLILIGALLGGCLIAVEATAQASNPHTLSTLYNPGDDYMRIGFRGAMSLPYQVVDGHALVGLSALAWDQDESVLYAMSDTGVLFHLQPVLEAGLLIAVEPVAAHALKQSDGTRLRGEAADAEGLHARHHDNGKRGDTELVVSFERIPRIARFSTDGRPLGGLHIPGPVEHGYRGSNKGLESVTETASLGVVTGPEWPKPDIAAESTIVYSLEGHQWSFPRYPATNSALVAMEALPDDSLLVLERSFSTIWQPLIITLRRTEPLGESSTEIRIAHEVVVLNSFAGWQIDNFEGLSLHGPANLFLVSDDNASWPQKTLLLYLELLQQPAEPKEPPAQR